MNKFLRLVFLAVVGLVASASAFTTVQPMTTSMRAPASVAMPQHAATPAATSSTSLSVIVDPAIADMMAKSDPVGAIFMMALVVSFWELTTSGRAKKEA